MSLAPLVRESFRVRHVHFHTSRYTVKTLFVPAATCNDPYLCEQKNSP